MLYTVVRKITYALAREPGFVWKIKFRSKSQPTQLGAKNISVVLSSSPVEIWGKCASTSKQTEITIFHMMDAVKK